MIQIQFLVTHISAHTGDATSDLKSPGTFLPIVKACVFPLTIFTMICLTLSLLYFVYLLYMFSANTV